MTELSYDMLVRTAAIDWIREQNRIFNGVLSRNLLARGFEFQGNRIRLVGPQGIFKPEQLPEMPLTIFTSPQGPYQDSLTNEGLKYCYRGENPYHHENVGLRLAFQRGVPLIYIFKLMPSRYLAICPVYIVADDPANLTFTVAFDAQTELLEHATNVSGSLILEPGAESRRAYVTRVVMQRVHQQAFRQRVLQAYHQQCALCHLRHQELLDAAHIIPDSEPEGVPEVYNGLSLCKLHHAAFDRHFLGIRPDYIVEIRQDVLNETDGPMLRHGLQGLHQQKIAIPRRPILRPNPALLERRYERFRASSPGP